MLVLACGAGRTLRWQWSQRGPGAIPFVEWPLSGMPMREWTGVVGWVPCERAVCDSEGREICARQTCASGGVRQNVAHDIPRESLVGDSHEWERGPRFRVLVPHRQIRALWQQTPLRREHDCSSARQGLAAPVGNLPAMANPQHADGALRVLRLRGWAKGWRAQGRD